VRTCVHASVSASVCTLCVGMGGVDMGMDVSVSVSVRLFFFSLARKLIRLGEVG
jgi:hypothetical protein